MSRHTLFFILLVQSSKFQVRPQPPNIPDHLKILFPKKTTRTYNPNYGYEPYWLNGEWVYMNKQLPPGVTTTPVPLVCGEECLDLYTRVGMVCGRQVDNIQVKGCMPSVFSWFCSGYDLDDQAIGYHTFQSYCKFLDAQCRTDIYNKWILVHGGPCVYPQNLLIKDLHFYEEPVSRMEYDLTSLASLFDNYTIAHTIFGTKA